MAQDFDEVRNPADAAMADLKGKIRARFTLSGMSYRDLAVQSNKTIDTIYRVMFANNVRHTWATLFDICRELDVRIGAIDGFLAPRVRRELAPPTKKEMRAINQILREIRKSSD